MKQVFLLATLVAVAHGFGRWEEGLSVRFDIGLGVGRDFFIPVPQTLNEAKNARWVESTRAPNQPLPSLILYTPSINDAVLGALYDAQGNVAGLQIAYPQDSVTGVALDWEVQGFTEWTAPANAAGNERKYWITAVYFVSEATLAKSPEERAATRKGRILQEENIYVTGFNGELMAISTTASEVTDTATTHFTRQNCIPFMGRHYYYNMTTETECTSEGLFPWFTLVDEASWSNQLLGTGILTYLELPESALVRNYFERPGVNEVKQVVPNAPQCVYDMVETYGVANMHIYFIESPLLVNCFFT